MANKSSNATAAGNGAITPRFQSGLDNRAVPDQSR
jgi:hypothetical protein